MRDAKNVVEPEEVQTLKTSEQDGRDPVRERTFVLFGFPVEFVGPDGFEFIELRPEYSQVEVMAKVDPCEDKEGEIGADEGVVEVIEGFRCLEDQWCFWC